MAKKIEEIKNVFDLTDKVAIVTGGYGHLGSAMVLALLGHNATVVVAGRTKEKFKEKFSSVSNPRLHFIKIDIEDSGSIKSCFKETNSRFGHIDILVNNAHFARGSALNDISDEDWSYSLDGVLGSVHKCIREVKPYMQAQNSGKIVNISSMYGVVSPNPALYQGEDCEKYTNPPHYGAAKAGVIQLTKYFAANLGVNNIQVNSITPGPFPKEHIQEENPAFIERLKKMNPLKKIGRSEDLSGVCVLLGSQGSNFITGQNFIVDGGWTAW